MDFDRLAGRVAGNPALVRRGRDIATDILIEAGDRQWFVSIHGGEIAAIRKGPLVMPSWRLAFRAPAEVWDLFLQQVPPPGSHDVFALIKRGAMRIEGDMLLFMAHILYFKGLLASLRMEARA